MLAFWHLLATDLFHRLTLVCHPRTLRCPRLVLAHVRVSAGQNCIQAGYAYITTAAECEAAAAAINFSYRTFY